MSGTSGGVPTLSTLTRTELAIGRPGPARGYVLTALAFLASFAVLLLGVVDLRRGFLFSAPDYFRIGSPSTILYVDPRQILLLAGGALVMWLSYRRMAALERMLDGPRLKGLAKLVAVALFLILVADLVFLYRGIAAARIASAARIGVGQVVPVSAFPGWAQALRAGIDYLALTWHATLLALLLGGLFLSLVGGAMKNWLSGYGLKTHVSAVALALPQPFCSCCAAPIGASLYRQGASLGATLAFVVSSPTLNLTALLLAALLLPPQYAVVRIAGGLLISVVGTYAVSRIAARWTNGSAPRLARTGTTSWLSRVLERYFRLFDLQPATTQFGLESPAQLISNWTASVWRLGKVVVPVLFLGSVVAAAIVSLIPSPENNLAGVLVAAAAGTLLMVPTWTEMPIAVQLIQEGLSGPAATLLLALPATSVPCLAVISGAVANVRVALLLGLMVFASAALVGGVFLLL